MINGSQFEQKRKLAISKRIQSLNSYKIKLGISRALFFLELELPFFLGLFELELEIKTCSNFKKLNTFENITVINLKKKNAKSC